MNDPDFSSTFQTSRKDHSKIGLPFRVPVLGWFLCAALQARRRKSRELGRACERRDEGGCPWLDPQCEACQQRTALASERILGKPRSLARQTLLRRFAKWQETIQKLAGGAE